MSKHQHLPAVINAVAGVVSAADCTVECHYSCNRSIDFFGGFFFVGLMLPAGSRLMKMLSMFQHSTGCPLWAIFCSSVSFISSLVWQRHITVALPELHQREAQPFKVLRHLHCAQRSKAISRMLNRVPSSSMKFSMKP